MKQETYPMTQLGYEALADELEQLETYKRAQAKKRIKQARAFCDFQEDSEYEAALDALASIEKRIATIQYKLQNARITTGLTHDFIEVGNTVTIVYLDTKEEETYTIVNPEEADPENEKISYYSPIAQALLYSKVNEIVTFSTPDGKNDVKINAII